MFKWSEVQNVYLIQVELIFKIKNVLNREWIRVEFCISDASTSM